MWSIFKRHWPEYFMEAAGLGLFMLSICFFTVLLEYPGSPARHAIPDPVHRRALIGLAIGLTAILLIYSPWGKQSGAHLNPSVTLTFLRLGKVTPGDALFYVLAQFIGGTAGMLLAGAEFKNIMGHPTVNYVVTMPGTAGAQSAFWAETAIAFILMSVILRLSNTPAMARYTGLVIGGLIALYITLEAPLSGTSMNPARSFSSAFAAHSWTALWIYFTAPLLGMLVAAEIYGWRHGVNAVSCAKLHHQNHKRCIFCEPQN
jgi:aquaporin Z